MASSQEIAHVEAILDPHKSITTSKLDNVDLNHMRPVYTARTAYCTICRGANKLLLSAADDQLRTTQDAPTLGLLLCEIQGESIVEYALRDIAKPI